MPNKELKRKRQFSEQRFSRESAPKELIRKTTLKVELF
jgi:hypothetical protein